MRPERLLRLQAGHEVLELLEAVEGSHRAGERAGRGAVDPADTRPELALAQALEEPELHQHAVDRAAGEDDRHVFLHAPSLGQDAAPSYRTLPSSTSSIRCSVVSSSSTPDAPALSSTCSGRLAPTIAEATFGSCSTQASASCAGVSPSSSAIRSSCCTRSRSVWSLAESMNAFICSEVARLSAGGGPPGLYLPVRTPCASG